MSYDDSVSLQIKAKVDLVVSRLEAMSPVPHPVRHGNSVSSTPTYAGPADPLLLGAWELVYASNGTVCAPLHPTPIACTKHDLSRYLNQDPTWYQCDCTWQPYPKAAL